jgi:hypothetical protein|tara:strand:- start:220 stop:528 length:309 start_codon:yes stop_codon:yes gene_type:complete
MKKKILTNSKVIEAWQRGERAANHRGTLKCYSDGTLYSYGLHIGRRTPSGVCIVGDYTAPAGGFRSVTTSCHVGRAKGIPGVNVMHPLVWVDSPLSNEEIPF